MRRLRAQASCDGGGLSKVDEKARGQRASGRNNGRWKAERCEEAPRTNGRAGREAKWRRSKVPCELGLNDSSIFESSFAGKIARCANFVPPTCSR